jgi:tricorn protease interacting factor F2/3
MTLAAAAANPAAVDRLWPWFEDNFERIGSMHPLLFERVVAAFVPGPGLQDPDRTRAYGNGLRQTHPQLKDVIALSLERLAVNDRFRRNAH